MSKILIIPDTHLKPKIFDLADKIMHEHEVDYAVQLGDNFDDFYCFEPEYKAHYVRMEQFAKDHPNTIWLYGNHEVSYIIHRPVTGNTIWGHQYSFYYHQGIFEPKFVHLDGKVVFSHAGIFQEFIDETFKNPPTSVKQLIEFLNDPLLVPFGAYWCDNSPIWARPQYDSLTFPRLLNGYLQVVGHTPLKEITKTNNIISTDVFSTNWGKRIASEKLIIVDTKTLQHKTIDIDFKKEFGKTR